MTGSVADWVGDSALRAEVEAQFSRAIAAYEANPNLISEHANHEESIRVGGYANRTLLELVQNAADAMAGSKDEGLDGTPLGRVEIVLDPVAQTLYCANSGRPFSKNGLTAIFHAHLSGKRGDEIGRFGLGFKSVLAVTDSPQVLSRSVSFEFNAPAAREAISAVGAAVRRVPVLRTATLLDADPLLKADPILKELGSWATTIVRLPQVAGLDRLRLEMESFSSEFLLFVSAVREVRLRVLGPGGFETSHASRDLGGGRYKIERPEGEGAEWFVGEVMHTPSAKARRDVGEAVSRDKIKVSVAIPSRISKESRTGRFWSYFPLHDETSASGLFNAPWSVNDDRTTLLRNDYNREILAAQAEIFVDLLPKVVTAKDPAALLDYLPARGREAIYFGDEQLCALVPRLAVTRPLLADGEGKLCTPSDLVPLDFEWDAPEIAHEAWIGSPNTSTDVPHWRCYSSPQRVARLRQLFANSVDPDELEQDGRDMKRALAAVPKRGILTWLKQWAEGTDAESSANALKFAFGNQSRPEVLDAKVIPTTGGLRSLSDNRVVFLRQADDIEVDGAVFVNPEFLRFPGVERILRDAGFRDLDPIAILRARIARLTPGADVELQAKFWDAALDVGAGEALAVIRNHPEAPVLVPTRDGGWNWPQKVIDLDEPLPTADSSVLLDRKRCIHTIARSLGVVNEPRKDFSLEDEFEARAYEEWVLGEVNSRLTAGDRAVEKVSLYPSREPVQGPFSMLFLLRDAGASEQTREAWTHALLEFGDAPWDCEDTATGVNYRVKSPVRWAAEEAGLLRTTRGYRSPRETVAPSLIQYRDVLPLFEGSRSIVDALGLPKELSDVPVSLLREALATEMLPPTTDDALLADFIVAASTLAYPQGQPDRIPARVGRVFESRPTRTVHIAVTEEQRDYLTERQRPYLQATEDQAATLIDTVGCLRFEDSFAFSVQVDGQQEPERLLDVFTGLRTWQPSATLSNATLARAASVAKWVTTADGVETQSLEYHLDGVALVVQAGLDERSTLRIVSDAFSIGLDNADIEDVLRIGLDHHLELLRQEALAAPSDTARLEAYFGNDDLREKLPSGLWQGLETQGLVSSQTQVADLYLSVYGKDTVKELAELFRLLGFPDVPNQWAGGAATISWLRRMGFSPDYAGRPTTHQPPEFVVPGATILNPLHDYQQEVAAKLREVLLENRDGRSSKAMLVLPTGAGKTRVATQTVLQMFIDGELRGTVLWIAQSQELCEQAVQTFSEVWRGLCTHQRVDRPLSVARLWEGNEVHAPDTAFSVVVATDAKLATILDKPNHSDYDWLATPAAVFVDEGHVAGDSPRYTKLLSWLGVDGRNWERPLIGLSATPFKGNSVERTKSLAARFGNRPLQAFAEDEDVYSELVKLGVLARVRHDVLEGGDVEMTAAEADHAKRWNRVSDDVLNRVAANHRRMANLVNSIRALDNDWGRKVLVFTPNVLSAQVLAATLRFHGMKADSVSGQTGRQSRRDVISRFKDGDLQVLANCELLTQGFDAPGVTALYIARPTFSPNAYIQMAGRGLRGPKNGGKEECLIVDMADNFGRADINNLLGFREYEALWQEQQP